jgi:branched-chain amino acid transport system ATP-binding protein
MSRQTDMSEPILSVRDLTVHFGGLVAISRLSFDVREGEVTSLIGPNGAGKTTAFNAITGFLPPTEGTVHYRKRNVNGLRPNEIADLGLVRTFQKTSLFGGVSVFENVMIGLHLQGERRAWEILLGLSRVRKEEETLREKAQEVLEFVGLAGRAFELADALPYGEQRLLEVAIALASKPSLLLLDEPVSGMNPSETASFMKMIEKIQERNITILLVEHDMKIVMGVSDHVVVLNQGEIISEGPPEAIRNDPEVIKAYLGHGGQRA